MIDQVSSVLSSATCAHELEVKILLVIERSY